MITISACIGLYFNKPYCLVQTVISFSSSFYKSYLALSTEKKCVFFHSIYFILHEQCQIPHRFYTNLMKTKCSTKMHQKLTCSRVELECSHFEILYIFLHIIISKNKKIFQYFLKSFGEMFIESF